MNPAAQDPEDAGLSSAQVEYRDAVRLKLLMIFHYILGGLAVGAGLTLPLVLLLLLVLPQEALEEILPGLGWSSAQGFNPLYTLTSVLVLGSYLVYGLMALLSLAGGPVALMIGRRLRDRRDWDFCRRWGDNLWWLLFPLGIPLGISLRETLERRSIQARFSW